MLTKLSSSDPVLLDGCGLPRYWSTVWALFHGSSFALSTLGTKLGHIDALYRHAESMDCNLDDVLANLNLEQLGSILEAFFVQLRNVPRPTASATRRWEVAFHFARSTCLLLEKSPTAGRTMADIQARIFRLDNHFLGLRPFRRRYGKKPRAIPRAVVAELLEVVQPGHSKNPFTTPATQWRVYVLICLLLLQGLRIGEALSLMANFLKSERDYRSGALRHRLTVVTNELEDDPRAQSPSLKNENAIRTIPVTPATAEAFLAYAENYRGRVNHGYFLSSARNRPLSFSGATKALEQLTEALSPEARAQLLDATGATYLRPHALRHTCAVVRMKQLLATRSSVDQAMMHMRSFFGWSKNSLMPQYYGKVAMDERLNESWNDTLDERVSILRTLPV